MSDFPRRIQIPKWTPAEHAITAALRAVEEMGADVRLTGAVVLLCAAQARVADFVDGVEGYRTISCQAPEHFAPYRAALAAAQGDNSAK